MSADIFWTPGKDKIFNVIADAKVRELKDSMEKASATSSTSRILHFSDGTMSVDELQGDDDDESHEDSGPIVDPVSTVSISNRWFFFDHYFIICSAN